MNKYSQLFREREEVWFNKISSYIHTPEKILKIGNGFGHLSEMIRSKNRNTIILDVATFPETINKEHVTLYNGGRLAFPDKNFDTCVLNLTLHHVKNSRKYFKEQIVRVTKNRIILIEETYDNIFQKIHLVFRDWYLNRKAGQYCDIHWDSYFSRNEMTKFIADNNMTIRKRVTTKHHSYYKELLIIDISA